MGRVCHVPSLLCAELSLNHFFDWNTNQGCLLIKTEDNLKTNRNIRTKYFPLE